MVGEGHGLVFISHKLNEVMAISDRVTVLRDGRMVGTIPGREATRDTLVRMMVGREVKPLAPQPMQTGEIRLKIQKLRAMGDRGAEMLRGLDLEVRGGEVVGIAGVSGNGQRELAQCLAGLRNVLAGTITIEGKDMTHATLRERLDAGLAYVPEERMRDGAIREFSVEENLFLRDHGAPAYTRGPFLDFRKMSAQANRLVAEYAVKTPQLQTPIKNLSGGNIQKLILARELSRHPKILIAAQPTRGVDIGATEYIHQRLMEQRAAGTAILLISEDLDEVRALSDRIAVMYEGQIIGIVQRGEATVDEIGLMMAGISADKTAPQREVTAQP
jgi:simple sugar transport system ATP-binding protein